MNGEDCLFRFSEIDPLHWNKPLIEIEFDINLKTAGLFEREGLFCKMKRSLSVSPY